MKKVQIFLINFIYCFKIFNEILSKAFWIEKGFSGEVVHDQKDGPVFNVYDETRTSPEYQLFINFFEKNFNF